MSATLQLKREGFGIELRRGTFDISLDGNNVGTIDWQQPVAVPLEPGRHTLRMQAGRYSSHTRSFDAQDGDVVSFRCHGAMVWPRYVVSLILPDLGIALRRQ